MEIYEKIYQGSVKFIMIWIVICSDCRDNQNGTFQLFYEGVRALF